MAQTLLLDQTTWDLCLDTSGNWAVASEPYAVAQDAASALRTFRGEMFYDTNRGVPYFGDILGAAPPLSLVKSYLSAAAAEAAPAHGLTASQIDVFLSGLSGRKLTGQVQIKAATGQTTAIGF